MTTRTVPVGEHRALAVDDVGDPGGTPVLYLHGTPDSRLSRHPDDGLVVVGTTGMATAVIEALEAGVPV